MQGFHKSKVDHITGLVDIMWNGITICFTMAVLSILNSKYFTVKY